MMLSFFFLQNQQNILSWCQVQGIELGALKQIIELTVTTSKYYSRPSHIS